MVEGKNDFPISLQLKDKYKMFRQWSRLKIFIKRIPIKWITVTVLIVLMIGGFSLISGARSSNQTIKPLKITTKTLTLTGKPESSSFKPVQVTSRILTLTAKPASGGISPVSVTSKTLTLTGKYSKKFPKIRNK